MVERVEFEGGTITVEYELAPQMVVFSHDFASLRDDRGLLNDIAANLPQGFGYVLFDYYDTDPSGRYIQIKTFAEQLHRLQAVLDWLRKREQVQYIDLIGHSMGCIVVAKLNPSHIRKILLLAPPTTLGDDMRRYSEIAGGKEVAGIWKFQRADGIVVSIPDTFFNEVKRIDGEAELNELALQHAYLIILPSTDEVLNDVDYTGLIVMPSVHAEAVENTNHYFEGSGRAMLLSLVQEQLLADS